MDVGSTENANDVTVFMEDHHITPEPAAVGEQNQNPVEREVQTLKKGVSALLIDQETSLERRDGGAMLSNLGSPLPIALPTPEERLRLRW